MRCASRLFGSRRSRGTLEGLQVGIRGGGRGIHPGPSFAADLGGDARQLVQCQPFQQGGIVEVHARIAFREQVTANTAARLLVGVQPDEAHQRMAVGVNLAFRQAVTQGGRATLPLRCIVERSVLRCVIVSDGQRHELVERDGIGPVVGH